MTETGRVTVEGGVVVGTGGGRDLRADVYRPPDGTANGTGVLLIHGGGWIQGDRSQLRGYGILLGRQGYTCVACEYRLAPDNTWPAQIEDVKAALRFMRAQAGPLAIDPARIAVSGNSAGAHLALMLAGTQNRPEFEGAGGHAGAGTEVAAAVAFYAPTDFTASIKRGLEPSALAFLMGVDVTAEDVAVVSPRTYAGPEFPPTLLITGNRDELVHWRESLVMYEALVSAGARAELHIYDGAPHGFDALPDFGRQCAAILALFLDRHVVNPRSVAVPTAAG